MKTTILGLLLFFVGTSFCFGQQIENSDKIVQVYGQEWFDRMQSSNPGALQLFDSYVSNGFTVEEISDEKYNSFQELESIPLRSKTESVVTIEEFLSDYNSGDFNPLKYSFFPGSTMQIFKLHGVNMIIKIQPQSNLINN